MSHFPHLRAIAASLIFAALATPAAQAATSTKSFTITNTGNGPLTLTTAAQPVSGNTTEYALTGNTCSNIAVGASCALTVSFTPSGSGTRPEATLNFSSNGTNGPNHSIALTGTGGASCTAGKQVFSYTGADQVVQVPSGCSAATIKAWGAGGRAGHHSNGTISNPAGAGGFAQRMVSGLQPGASLVIVVGQGATGSTATYGGGGAGYNICMYGSCGYGGAGGGLSGVFLGSKSQGNALAVAGGGGGSLYSAGGAGGGTAGVTGSTYTNGYVYTGGGGGTQTAGGAGGGTSEVGYGSPGSALRGGSGLTLVGHGGGGGYWGGGGALYAGAGGGSGYAPGGTLVAGSGCAVANSSDPDYVVGVGKGGCSQNTPGQNGRVVIQWGP